MYTAIYRSPEFSGLSHVQRRALAELLIGTRRSGPDGSAWLALNRASYVGGCRGLTCSRCSLLVSPRMPVHIELAPALLRKRWDSIHMLGDLFTRVSVVANSCC